MDNTQQTAVALFYDGEAAPKVTAKGSDEIAEAIIAIATECEVPLYQNKELVHLLAGLELGEEIPELLYFTIAEIIAFAYKLQGKYPKGWQDTTENNQQEVNKQEDSQQKNSQQNNSNQLPHLPDPDE
ncbi:EscU/YscU/HrcU family type III secretion system export apparatus switch protein [Endozoicomonas sp. SM1973]|uniref:Flagellar biosynthetic protein FlhB n=1 Tax=Spartinivicinus marinus TaxID=2994442 RepID=A0A853I7C8_9GAMM|nr:EscU/YscU/HrcU family type III secretion system export apparatus switch protein [Spartinivicinus marinus]MCX4028950.1 EscU/YscU/HrcU family type III secretion system export apparatus switch protein [Spartinivicinus marinus]NYZ65467.1 EscU/YscU/HrcU family type III secretion system export apparatus switch protein [Spartinivicinus marinus]